MRRPVLLRPLGRLPFDLLPSDGLQGSQARQQPQRVHRPLKRPRSFRVACGRLRALGDPDGRSRVGAGAPDGDRRDSCAVRRAVAERAFLFFF